MSTNILFSTCRSFSLQMLTFLAIQCVMSGKSGWFIQCTVHSAKVLLYKVYYLLICESMSDQFRLH